MDPTLSPIDVVQHWPFVDRHLRLERKRGDRTALAYLARRQLEADGNPVLIGRKRLREDGVCKTEGEAGAFMKILAELVRRRVIDRRTGRGSAPGTWSLRADIGHWDAMPWMHSGRGVLRAISGCNSRAQCAIGAQNAAQRAIKPRKMDEFWIAPRDHLLPPGLLLVDMRGNGATCAATAQPRAWDPVDMRGNGAGIGPIRSASPSSLELEIPSLTEEEEIRFAKLKAVLEFHARARGQTLLPGLQPERRLRELARVLDDAACSAVCRHFDNTAGDVQVPSGSITLESMARRYLPTGTAAL